MTQQGTGVFQGVTGTNFCGPQMPQGVVAEWRDVRTLAGSVDGVE